jgi:hypothetical protein
LKPRAVSANAKPSWEFIGLNESIMRDFSFENITIVSGVQNGWSCQYTQGFTFKNVSHPPLASSNCITQKPDPEPSAEPGFKMIGNDGACRDSNGKFPAWGSAKATNSECAKTCTDDASCDAYMSTNNGLYCQFYCTSGLGKLCTVKGNGGGIPSTTTHQDQERYCWLKQPKELS